MVVEAEWARVVSARSAAWITLAPVTAGPCARPAACPPQGPGGGSRARLRDAGRPHPCRGRWWLHGVLPIAGGVPRRRARPSHGGRAAGTRMGLAAASPAHGDQTLRGPADVVVDRPV